MDVECCVLVRIVIYICSAANNPERNKIFAALYGYAFLKYKHRNWFQYYIFILSVSNTNGHTCTFQIDHTNCESKYQAKNHGLKLNTFKYDRFDLSETSPMDYQNKWNTRPSLLTQLDYYPVKQPRLLCLFKIEPCVYKVPAMVYIVFHCAFKGNDQFTANTVDPIIFQKQ